MARVEFIDGTQALIRVSGDGAVQEVAMSGEPVPNTGVQLGRFGVPVQNARGDTLAVASLNSPTNSSALVFAPEEGGHSFAVRKGDTVGDIANSIFTSFQIGVVNEEQHCAFLGKVIGQGVNALNDDGVWHLDKSPADPDAGGPLLVAREGRQAAGTPPGAKWASFRSIALPDGSKGPVFLADLVVPLPGRPNPARVTARNNSGLWAVDSSGVLRLLLREGDRFPETSLTVRAISILGNVAGSPAQTRSYNARGDLIYRATLSDGSEVIAKASIP